MAEKKVDSDFLNVEGVNNDWLQKQLEELRQTVRINKDFQSDMKAVFADMQKNGYFDKDGNFNERKAFAQGNLDAIKKYSVKPGIYGNVIEYNDRKQSRMLERPAENIPGSIVNLEIADNSDERVLGIPYGMATAGDRVYVVNGKVFTGWALYFSLSSIKSPEDYARNVDLVYNVPYLYASILLKAQLGLGTGFDVNYGTEDNKVPEEELIRDYLFKKLRINKRLLIKTGFHLGTYGNAYWHLKRDKSGNADKVTIMQPERMKIFLDPMTTKILFYIYLPPIIGGTTIASYPSDGRYNPNVLTGVTLSYPTPIVMRPQDVLHFKINDFTEYPFGFSEVRPCLDPATARLDVNLLAPIIFKKYAKPMVHWSINSEGLGPNQVNEKRTDMLNTLENLEPGSDIVTTDLWTSNVISLAQGKQDIFALAQDMDTQIFATTGAPETYFKPKGSTDRMISEQDKTFISRLKVLQDEVGERIFDELIVPRIDKEMSVKEQVESDLHGTDNMVEGILKEQGSYIADTPKYPEVSWNEVFKQDETQSIANTIALLNAGIISNSRAASRIGEKPRDEQHLEDQTKVGIDEMPRQETFNVPLLPTQQLAAKILGQSMQYASDAAQIANTAVRINPLNNIKKQTEAAANPQQVQESQEDQPGTPKGATAGQNGTPSDMEGNMELLRGGLNAGPNFDRANVNLHKAQDPNKLGGSAYKQGVAQGKPVKAKDKRGN